MIIKCYNCNELIGDNLDQCPLCHAKQFNEHKKTPKPDVYKLRQERVSNAMKAYKKRCRIQYVFVLAELVFLLAGFTIGGITNLIYNPLFLLGLFVTPFALQFFGMGDIMNIVHIVVENSARVSNQVKAYPLAAGGIS